MYSYSIIELKSHNFHQYTIDKLSLLDFFRQPSQQILSLTANSRGQRPSTPTGKAKDDDHPENQSSESNWRS
jgi:hypothetical protein